MDEGLELLFRTMGQILHNQNKIMKQLGIIKNDYEYGYEDDSIQLEKEVFDYSTRF